MCGSLGFSIKVCYPGRTWSFIVQRGHENGVVHLGYNPQYDCGCS